jgi:hypothetical protein
MDTLSKVGAERVETVFSRNEKVRVMQITENALYQNPLSFGPLEIGVVVPGLGERARLGCHRVRPAPDMEKFQRPSAAFFSFLARECECAPRNHAPDAWRNQSESLKAFGYWHYLLFYKHSMFCFASNIPMILL